MKNKVGILEILIEELYTEISDEEVDEILESISIKTELKEFEKMDVSIKKLYERLDLSKKTSEERKKLACGIYAEELIEQIQNDKIK